VRILIAHNRYRLAGGEERHVELLESGLAEAGIQVRRFEQRSGDLDHRAIKRMVSGLALTYRPGGGGIRPILREWQPSVVHFHNIWPLLTPSALRAAKVSGAAVVMTIHNYRFACPGGMLLRGSVVHDDCIYGSSLRCGLRNPRQNRLESVAYGFALELQRRLGMLRRWVDAFIAPSEFMAGMLVRAGLPHERVRVIRHGLPLGEQPPPPGRRYVLFAGRLSAEKGVETLLAAARLRPEIPTVFAGDGPLVLQVKLAGNGVEYAGMLSPSAIKKAFRDAAFTVAPSEWNENCPLSVLESFAAGRAVIATRIGGLPELVEPGKTGLLVEPHSPHSLAAAVAAIWNDPKGAAEMGRRARAEAEDRFGLGRQIADLIELYSELESVSKVGR
jgi:glycosyltransferase involved in cell wall biosynthesis